MRLLLAVILILAAGTASAQDLQRGRRVFTRCIACHTLEPGRGPMPGPSLIGVVGRTAGTLPGYEYSSALSEAGKKGVVWTEEALDRFLTDTEAFLPGTVMGVLKLPQAADRKAVIDLLKSMQ